MEENKTEGQKDAASTTPTANSKDVEENKGITYLSYLWILFLIPMLTKKDSKFAMFHAKQGLVLFAVSVIIGFISSYSYALGSLLNLVVLVLAIMGLVNVNKGEMKDLPVIGDLAKKINL